MSQPGEMDNCQAANAKGSLKISGDEYLLRPVSMAVSFLPHLVAQVQEQSR